MIKNLIKEILKEDFAGYKSKAKNIKFSHSLHDPLFLKDPDKNVLKAKQLKRIWNEEADHNFFKNEVIKIHWLSDEGKGSLSERLANILQLSGKDEISAAGYLQGPFNSIWGDVGIILDGHVTFASNDMDTVRSGYYGDVPEDFKSVYKNTSGIPKRPTENTSFSINNMILDKASFKQNSMSNNEFIVDNWKIVGIIFTDDFCADCADTIDMGFNVDNIPIEKCEEGKILKVVKESGIPVVRKKDRNLIAKWPFSNNEGFVKLKKLIKEMSEVDDRVRRILVTEVPAAAIDSVKTNGLLSAKKLSKMEDLLKLSRPNKKEREEFIKNTNKSNEPFLKGPNAYIKPPPEDLELSPQHPSKKFKTIRVLIDIDKLLDEQPDTKFYGMELVPFPVSEDAWLGMDKKEQNKLLKDLGNSRERFISTAELDELLKRSDEELWSHYDKKSPLYAGDVPHVAIIAKGGVIDPRFLKILSSQK